MARIIDPIPNNISIISIVLLILYSLSEINSEKAVSKILFYFIKTSAPWYQIKKRFYIIVCLLVLLDKFLIL